MGRRWRFTKSGELHKAIEKASEEFRNNKHLQHSNAPQAVRDPVVIFKDNNWITVDKSN